MVQNSVQNIVTPTLQLHQPYESFDTFLSIICTIKLNEFNYLQMKWFHIMTGSFKIKGDKSPVFWRFGWEKIRGKIFQRGGEKKFAIM